METLLAKELLDRHPGSFARGRVLWAHHLPLEKGGRHWGF
jgi:hypothetical protein